MKQIFSGAPIHLALALGLFVFAAKANSAPCPDGQLGDGVICEPGGSWVQHEIGIQADAIYVFVTDQIGRAHV